MRRIVCRAAAAVLAAAPGARAATPPPPAPMTFEEVLSDQRAVRGAWFSPEGEAVLVAVERNDRPTGGAPWKLTGTEARIWRLHDRAETAVGGPGAAFLPSPCEPWSPSGRFVAGFVLADGRKSLAVFDRRHHRLVRFAASPTVQCVRWVGERLVFPLAAPDAPTLGGSTEVAAAGQLARWRAAWTGPSPQVTVHSSNPAVAGSTAPEPGGLGLADPASGKVHRLAPGGFHSVTPSPDGRRFAVARYGADDPDALSTRTGRRSELLVFEMTPDGARRSQAAAAHDVDYASFAWSPDGARVLAVARPVGEHRVGLLAMEAGSGRPSFIALPAGLTLARAPAGAYSRHLPGGWIGRSPAFLAVRGEGRAVPPLPSGSPPSGSEYGPPEATRLYALTDGRITPIAEATPQPVTAFAGGADEAVFVAGGALWSAAPGQTPRRLTPASLEVVALAEMRPSMGLAPVWAVQPHRVAMRVRQAGGERTVVLDRTTGQAHAFDAPVALAPGLDAALRVDRAGWSATLQVDGPAPGPLTVLNAAWRDRPVAATVRFTYRVGDRQLTGWIVRPAIPAARPPPALVWIYGGRLHGASPPKEALPGYAGPPVFAAQLWAARGYAVIYPSTPVPAAADADVAGSLAAAAVGAVDAAAERGWIDPRRVGIIGHSFGGFSAAAVLSRRSDRFAAAIAMSGDYDYAAAWGLRGPWDWMQDREGNAFGEPTVGQVEDGQIGLRAPPFATPEAYRWASPFYAAAGIRTPLMLTAGDLEPGATGLAQAERFYAALRRTGNPAVLVRYWGQGHVQDDPWASLDHWRRFNAWFEHYLRGEVDRPR